MQARQLQYQGYLQTPYLWYGKGPAGLIQLELSPWKVGKFSQQVNGNLRLGKLVERFVSEEFKEHPNIEILAENIQIQRQKLTLGELDCLLLFNGEPVHLEIIYKFYLYDPNVGETELDHWIGPNRRDSLVQKITKLSEKQLPLLYNPQTAGVLEELGLKPETMLQRVCFKAQLFLPLDYKEPITVLNPHTVYGYYVHFKEMDRFNSCKIYIPRKHDWLITPHPVVDWMNFESAKQRLSEFYKEESAPLVWVKHPKGSIEKLFVIWW